MRVVVILLAFMLAGCADLDDDGQSPPLSQVEENTVPGVSHETLLPVAEAAALAWNPDARLFLVAQAEGEPDFDMGRWQMASQAAPYGDGLADRWSFSFAPDTFVDRTMKDAVDTVEETTGFQQSRLAYVVIVGSDGEIISEYETQDDDEGAPNFNFLSAGAMSAKEAGAIAWAQRDYYPIAERADLTFSILADGMLNGEDPELEDRMIWFFQAMREVEDEAIVAIVGIDAITGEVVLLERF